MGGGVVKSSRWPKPRTCSSGAPSADRAGWTRMCVLRSSATYSGLLTVSIGARRRFVRVMLVTSSRTMFSRGYFREGGSLTRCCQ
jgi:hypothetical protein